MNLIANELFSRRWRVALIPINAGPPDFVELKGEVFPLQRTSRGGLLNTLLSFFRFQRLVRSWKPDVVILTCALPELFGAFLLLNPRMVVVEEAKIPWDNKPTLGKIIRFLLTLRGTLWVAASSHLSIWPHSKSPKTILQNALTPFVQSQSEGRNDPNLRRLAYVGRLSPEKQPEWFIEICGKLNTPGLVVGTGLMKESLEHIASNAITNIEFVGFVSEPWNLMQAGDLLIVPSLTEGDGLVVIEGLKANLPMLISDIPEFRHFHLPEVNYCKDVSAFVDRANQYQDSLDSLVVPEGIKEKILGERSPKSVGDAWESFLKTI